MICKFCNSENTKKVDEIEYIGEREQKQMLYQCTKCGLVFSNVRFFEEKQGYLNKGKNQKLIDFISNFLNKYYDNGIQDINTTYADICLDNLYVGLSNWKIDNNSTELLLIADHLEHCSNLNREMDFVRRLKTKYICLETPVYNNYSKKSLDMYGIFTEEHYNYFSFACISTIMNFFGYEKIVMREYGKDIVDFPMIFPCQISLWKKRSVEKKMVSGLENNIIFEYVEECKKRLLFIQEWINKNIPDNCRIAIWGTSNYAKKLLGMTNLKHKNIVKFYDANQQVWGKEILGKPVCTFSMEDMQHNRIEKVFVASNTAYDDICDRLVREYGINKEKILGLETDVLFTR